MNEPATPGGGLSWAQKAAGPMLLPPAPPDHQPILEDRKWLSQIYKLTPVNVLKE